MDALLLPTLLTTVLFSADPVSASLHAQQVGDVAALTREVTKLGPPDGALPGEVLAFGAEAFVVASVGTDAMRKGLIAAAHHGDGRVVVFGHNSFLDGWQADGFVANALEWVSSSKLNGISVLLLGDGIGLKTALATRTDSLKCQATLPSPTKLESYDAVVWFSGDLSDKELATLADYVEDGGGLLFGVCPWGRQQIWDGQGDGSSIRDRLPHNKLARRFGLVFGADTAGGETYQLDPVANAELHAGRTIERVLAALKSGGKKAKTSLRPGDAARVAALLRALPASDETFRPAIERALTRASLEDHVPAAGRAVLGTDAKGYLGMLLATTTWKELPAEEVTAAPGADFFPGAVPKKTKRISANLHFDEETVARGGWLSTGHYAPAGEPIALRVTRGEAKGWSLRIGAHKDELWHKDSWSRWPEVTLEKPLNEKRKERGAFHFASPFGGLVYLVPGKGAKAANFELEGVVEAPFFVLGDEASEKDWKRRRKAPAPWGEVACDGVVITVPSGALRKLEDPVALMHWWNEAMACYPELRGEPQPARPERLVEDIQISAGWMHSGYPVMTHGAEDTEHSAAVNLAVLQKDGNWGYFHEFGHNAQKSDWTFAGTGEVTCNLFSLYLGERMAGIEPWKNEWLENQKKKPAEYFKAGSDFNHWKSEPGLALMMYAELQREFGWDAFKEAFRAYLALPETERPKTDLEKHDRWLIEMSRATKRDLGAYFEKWGLPNSATARKQVSEFAAWIPRNY